MAEVDLTAPSLTAAPINRFQRYIAVVYAIYERDLDQLVLSDTFKYERFTEKELAYSALADRGNSISRYVILEEHTVLD